MRRAAQRLRVAVALEEAAPRRRRLRLVDVEIDRQLRIARLQRRMHQVAGHHGLVAALAEADGEVAGRVPRCRQQADVIAELVIVLHDLGASGLDHRQHAVEIDRVLLLRVLAVQ